MRKTFLFLAVAFAALFIWFIFNADLGAVNGVVNLLNGNTLVALALGMASGIFFINAFPSKRSRRQRRR